MFRFVSKQAFKPMGVYQSPRQFHSLPKAASTVKLNSAYSNAEAEKRLGFKIKSLEAIPINKMLAKGLEGKGTYPLLKTKKEVYKGLLKYISTLGYPTEVDFTVDPEKADPTEVDPTDVDLTYVNPIDPEFKGPRSKYLIYNIITPIVSDFLSKTKRKTIIVRVEDNIISVDGEAAGTGDFVVVDEVSLTEYNFVLVIQAKRSSIEKAMRQCLLTLKDMRDNNGEGEVYGFVATGESWQMLKYDGASFQSAKIDVLFPGMDKDKEKWIKDHSAVVECIYLALENGGIVKND